MYLQPFESCLTDDTPRAQRVGRSEGMQYCPKMIISDLTLENSSSRTSLTTRRKSHQWIQRNPGHDPIHPHAAAVRGVCNHTLLAD